MDSTGSSEAEIVGVLGQSFNKISAVPALATRWSRVDARKRGKPSLEEGLAKRTLVITGRQLQIVLEVENLSSFFPESVTGMLSRFAKPRIFGHPAATFRLCQFCVIQLCIVVISCDSRERSSLVIAQ